MKSIAGVVLVVLAAASPLHHLEPYILGGGVLSFVLFIAWFVLTLAAVGRVAVWLAD